jgi:prevent-host-death family protein
MLRKSAEEARNQLPDLLQAAEKGRPTIITRHGRPVAALVPIATYLATARQQPLTPVESRAVGKGQHRHHPQAAPRMGPLAFDDLSEQALLLRDSAPIIYFPRPRTPT